MESIRERVLEAHRQGADAVVELVVGVVAELAVQLESLSARVAALETENEALRRENQELRARLGTNSTNSSKPPSSDGPGVKPRPKSQWAQTRWAAWAHWAHLAVGGGARRDQGAQTCLLPGLRPELGAGSGSAS